MPHLMSNPKPIRKGASGGERALLWLAPFRLRRHQHRATFSNGSLEDTRDRRLRRRLRRLADGAVQHDELPVRTTAAGYRQFAYDRSTTSVL